MCTRKLPKSGRRWREGGSTSGGQVRIDLLEGGRLECAWTSFGEGVITWMGKPDRGQRQIHFFYILNPRP